jgi:ketosteroid isomerase-like protein
VATSLGSQLSAAIAAQDATAIAACFANDVVFRGLTPRGLRERSGADETASLIEAWFAYSTELELVDVGSDEIGDKLHIRYRFRGVEEGEPFVVEQQLYCSVEDDRIMRADLVCSGFRPSVGSAAT